MIFYSKERLYPTLINTLVLEDTEGGFWYVHRSVYDSALTLSVKQTADGLLTLIDSSSNSPAIESWYSAAPEPLNILAPYFGLISEELPACRIDVLAGVMHAITSQIDAYNFIKQPKAIRTTVKMSLSVLNEYQMAWDSFSAQCTKPQFKNPEFSGQRYSYPPMDEAHLVYAHSAGEMQKAVAIIEETDLIGDAEVGEELDLSVDELRANPNWTDLGGGTWYNAVTDECVCIELSEEEYQKEFDAILEGNMSASQEEEPQKETGSAQSALASKLKLGKRG